MSEIAGLTSLVISRLRADPALTALVAAARIQRAPVELDEGTETEPYVAFDVLAAPDRSFRTARIMTLTRFLVRGVTVGRDLTAGRQIADAIDAAILDAEADLPAYGVHVGKVWREEEHLQQELVDGVTFNNWGGRYRSHVWRL